MDPLWEHAQKIGFTGLQHMLPWFPECAPLGVTGLGACTILQATKMFTVNFEQ